MSEYQQERRRTGIGGRQAPGIGWEGTLAEAGTASEVVGVVKDYLAQWTPEEVALLPGPCRPGRIVDAEDVSRFAVELARAHCEVTADSPPLLEKLNQFFSAAAARLPQVLAEDGEPSTQ